MARITKSTIVEDLAQARGHGRDVRERHDWSDGTVTEVYYRAADKADVGALMAARVPVLEQQRAEQAARDSERAELERKQREAIATLDAAVVADVLMVSRDEAIDRGAKREAAR